MADESATATAARSVRSHRNGGCGFRRSKGKGAVVDSISCLPDVILQHILSFVPTKIAITTSLLSKRWRHLWCGAPSLSFDSCSCPMINKTLARYTAPKMMHFHLSTITEHHLPYMDMWIEFVMFRHLENLFLGFYLDHGYTYPDFFYTNPSLKQLTLFNGVMIPRCSVSWTSLKNMSLLCCSTLSDESMSNILSGCPVLESLTLDHCDQIRSLDLIKSLRLRTLVVYHSSWAATKIEAPHIHRLHLRNSESPCTLLDVSSLTEANLNVLFQSVEATFNADNLQDKLLAILEKVQHVEKLTLGVKFLQILSLAELCGVPFPVLKVKALTLETTKIFQYVIPGVERVLQNSHGLKKLTVRTSHCDTIPGEHLDKYLALEGLDPAQCWRSKDGVRWNKSRLVLEPKHLVSFVELVFKNTKTLEKVFLLLDPCHKFKEMVSTLSHYNKVSVALNHRV
ncbi:unnamed protein product [Microthlaspi erraticum]|uniref:Uncharacterized protein n=1 Tax=Microthlaspi erraticum TaxID=1685480 RepID=A0A6D2HLK2_9BRAS|nr:unnamed protein product [Microthlaspi erraticum]